MITNQNKVLNYNRQRMTLFITMIMIITNQNKILYYNRQRQAFLKHRNLISHQILILILILSKTTFHPLIKT